MVNAFTSAGGAAFSSNRGDWETPQNLYDDLDLKYHFTLDAAASSTNAKCAKFYTAEDSVFDHDWSGESVFCNPPYGRKIGDWVKKCAEEALKQDTQVVMLILARTDTKWFHEWIYRRAEIVFIRGRIRFCINGVAGDAAPFPSMLAIFGGGRKW